VASKAGICEAESKTYPNSISPLICCSPSDDDLGGSWFNSKRGNPRNKGIATRTGRRRFGVTHLARSSPSGPQWYEAIQGRHRSTDQKVGDSSSSGRATKTLALQGFLRVRRKEASGGSGLHRGRTQIPGRPLHPYGTFSLFYRGPLSGGYVLAWVQQR